MKIIQQIIKKYPSLIIKAVAMILILTWFSPMYYFAPDRSCGFFYYPKMAMIYDDYFSFMAWMKLLMPVMLYMIINSKELHAAENKFFMCGLLLLIDLIIEVVFALIMIEATYQNDYDVVSASLRPTGFFWIAIIAMLFGIIACFENAIWIVKDFTPKQKVDGDIFSE